MFVLNAHGCSELIPMPNKSCLNNIIESSRTNVAEYLRLLHRFQIGVVVEDLVDRCEHRDACIAVFHVRLRYRVLAAQVRKLQKLQSAHLQLQHRSDHPAMFSQTS